MSDYRSDRPARPDRPVVSDIRERLTSKPPKDSYRILEVKPAPWYLRIMSVNQWLIKIQDHDGNVFSMSAWSDDNDPRNESIVWHLHRQLLKRKTAKNPRVEKLMDYVIDLNKEATSHVVPE